MATRVRLGDSDLKALQKFLKVIELQVGSEDWIAALAHCKSQGLSNVQCGRVLGCSDRTVSRWAPELEIYQLNQSRGNQAHVSPSEAAAMLEPTADAFEKFYSVFSGRDLPAHAKPWIEAFLEHENVLINIPPRHAKSVVMAIWLPLWLITKNRNEQVLIVSKSTHLAVKHSKAIAVQLTGNALLIETYGEYAPDTRGEHGQRWSESSGELSVVGRDMSTHGAAFSVLVKGYQSAILGNEATTVIVDDVTDRRISLSPTENERQMDWLRSEVFSRAMPGAKVCVIGQRVGMEDIYGQLASQQYTIGNRAGTSAFQHFNFPAVIRWPNEDPENPEPVVLWPEVWPWEALASQVERVGTDLFRTYYQQDPVPSGGGIYRDEFADAVLDRDRRAWRGAHDRDEVCRVLSIDPSPTRAAGIVLADLHYPDDKAREYDRIDVLASYSFWDGVPLLLREMKRLITVYKPDFTIVEYSSYLDLINQFAITHDIKRSTRWIEQKTGGNKNDPAYGLLAMPAELEMGRIRFPYEDAESRALTDQFLAEAKSYPGGRTDDILMALWFVMWNRKKLRPLNPSRYASQIRVDGSGWGYISRVAREGARTRPVLSEDQRVAAFRKQREITKQSAAAFRRKLTEAGFEYDATDKAV